MSSLYDIEVKTISGEAQKMAVRQGQVLLIVNTASQCGFTPQYGGLEELHRKYSDRGFSVLGFPCNQFGNQEPGTDHQVATFCETTFGLTFPMFSKVEVNGKDTHPLFEYLKTKAPGILGSEAIKWNFTKFLVDRTGNIVARFAPTEKPEALASHIEKLL